MRTAMKSSPRSPELEKARAQQQRPNAAKKKLINLKKKKKWSLRIIIGPALSSEPSGIHAHMYNTFPSLFRIGKLLHALLESLTLSKLSPVFRSNLLIF